MLLKLKFFVFMVDFQQCPFDIQIYPPLYFSYPLSSYSIYTICLMKPLFAAEMQLGQTYKLSKWAYTFCTRNTNTHYLSQYAGKASTYNRRLEIMKFNNFSIENEKLVTLNSRTVGIERLWWYYVCRATQLFIWQPLL